MLSWDHGFWNEETWAGVVTPPPVVEDFRYVRLDMAAGAFRFLTGSQSANLDSFRDITPGTAGADLLKLSSIDDIRGFIGVPSFDEIRDFIGTPWESITSDNNIFTGQNRFIHNQGFNSYTEIRKDRLALDYSATRAALVIQHRDEANGAYNALIPGTVTSFYNDGDGWVDAATEWSMTIWTGNFTSVTKKGNGSGHAYTATGQLLACSAYNEGGAFQAMFTNNGSNLGYMSLFEGLLQDTPDNGVHHYSTAMIGAATRINKHNPTPRVSANFMASSEGQQPVDAALLANSRGYQLFDRFIDTRNATIVTGEAFLLGNNTNIAWENQAQTATNPILWVNNADDTYLSAFGNIHFVSDAVVDKMVIDTNHPTDSVCIFVGGALRRVILGASVSGGANLLLAI